MKNIFTLSPLVHNHKQKNMPLEDHFFLFILQKDVIARANICASSRDDEIISDDKHYVGERSTQFLSPSISSSLMCVNCSSCEHLEKKTDAQQKSYFYLITCNSCVPRQNLVFPVALIHLRLNYWLCWRAKN